MNLTNEAKAWIKAEAKTMKINPVGKSMEALLGLVATARKETTEVVLFLANGGKVEEVPGFAGIKPRPNRKETSAGGKVETTPKKAPRRISKQEEPKSTKPDSDLVSLKAICEELGVEDRIARRKLRGSDITKPGSSWEWKAGHKDIAKVKELLKK